MTDRPTSTKPRSQSADGSPCIARTSTSADGTAPGESELTAKAREVLAGLSKAQRDAVSDVATKSVPCCTAESFAAMAPIAREDAVQRDRMRNVIRNSDGTPKFRDTTVMVSIATARVLLRKRLAVHTYAHRTYAMVLPTDLGREVARLLSEVQS